MDKTNLFSKYRGFLLNLSQHAVFRDYLSDRTLQMAKPGLVLPNGYITYKGRVKRGNTYQLGIAPADVYARKIYPALRVIDFFSKKGWYTHYKDFEKAFLYELELIKSFSTPLGYRPSDLKYRFVQTTFNALSLDNNVQANNATYATAHDATTGAVEGLGQIRNDGNASVYVIRRYFCRWNTSSLTSDATITAADIKLYVTAHGDTDGTGADIVQSTATDGAIVGGDYDNLGTTVYGTKTLASLTDSAYNTWTLNATGQGQISKTANTKFAWRISQDTTNTAPSSVNAQNDMTFQQSGDANPEQLVVTYTLPFTATAALKTLLGVGI